MKILHTSDWHLGQIYKNQNREHEHQLFLDWLISYLQTDDGMQVDVLLIAGDIFDVGNPSNSAKKQYFNFLIKASQTSLKKIIVVAGNHDYASTLEAPSEVLAAIDIHVVGGLYGDYDKAVVDLPNAKNIPTRIFCAPFLRASDLLSVEGDESIDSAIKRSTKTAYTQGLKALRKNNFNGLALATGHLYAAGSENNSDSVRDIQIGNQGVVKVESFGDGFDYVALGHLHRPQRVAGQDHIRYSGSPIALSFSEYEDIKSMCVVEWDSVDSKPQISEVEIPLFRRMIRVIGSRADVTTKLKEIQAEDASQDKLESWIEIILPDEAPDAVLAADFRQLASELGLKVFGVQMQKALAQTQFRAHQRLEELSPIEVMKVVLEERPDQEELLKVFHELLQKNLEEK